MSVGIQNLTVLIQQEVIAVNAMLEVLQIRVCAIVNSLFVVLYGGCVFLARSECPVI